jgi:hypothetical protein
MFSPWATHSSPGNRAEARARDFLLLCENKFSPGGPGLTAIIESHYTWKTAKGAGWCQAPKQTQIQKSKSEKKREKITGFPAGWKNPGPLPQILSTNTPSACFASLFAGILIVNYLMPRVF